jgi:predicted transcriptional regulator
MPSAFRDRLEQDRRRASLSVARLSWQLGVSVREYRELVEGEAWPSYGVWERIAEFSGWPQTFVGPRLNR